VLPGNIFCPIAEQFTEAAAARNSLASAISGPMLTAGRHSAMTFA
jgi:hypothetical protein